VTFQSIFIDEHFILLILLRRFLTYGLLFKLARNEEEIPRASVFAKTQIAPGNAIQITF
jgi:hypothetical protein